ncbi:SDR family NAD(P)-dependent oxidoreductase [Actinoplanes bogorensis]|uniref:SDR family NAD(P)-dependent oxidoreductase n=1 Tax=Paractinoplanes bogorensis TaxID=1610840 RepID=A0ABS5YGR8_9ACTN|nr:SDR family NAD(P)-dependent oxidoreductase [Actinoplanes bogorensis]MBU2662582.1 SDR family NAD(P)-dependent oxidoreductase [Actinoplanes bogorensis]
MITTRFGAGSTADDVVAGLDLSGVRAIVTGASSGIGVETARSLARAGAHVTLAVRDTSAGARTAAEIADSIARAQPEAARDRPEAARDRPEAARDRPEAARDRPEAARDRPEAGRDRLEVSALDLADQSSVAAFVQRWRGPLHLLINNAGVVTSDLRRTAEGWEWQFATNHLGHFALSLGLHDALAAGARERGEARIVALTSGAHMRSPIVFDDLHFERRDYDPQEAYAQSKTANVLFAVEATRRWATDGIVANAANPGGVATGLQRDFTPAQKEYLARAEAAGVFTYKTTQQGAATTLVAAVAPEFAGVGGRYLDDGNEAAVVGDDANLFENSHAVKQWALDPETARRLWTVSTELVGPEPR